VTVNFDQVVKILNKPGQKVGHAAVNAGSISGYGEKGNSRFEPLKGAGNCSGDALQVCRSRWKVAEVGEQVLSYLADLISVRARMPLDRSGRSYFEGT
jgi:hypothetical protein